MRNRMLHIALLLLLVSASPGAGQRRGTPGVSERGGRGFFMVGVEKLELDELNASLTAEGFPTFSQRFLTLGGGGYFIRGRLILGGEGHTILQSDETTSDGAFRTRITGGFGMVNVGYQVLRGGRFAIYPLLALGGGAMNLRITERSTLAFDEILQNPRRGANLANGAFLAGAALGADWFIPAGEGGKGVVLGLRAGFNYAPLEPEWSMDGVDIANGPDAGFTGPWVRLTLGGGSR
ncbi:MAG: hypothetical protein ACREL7_16345 [Longimicrobiales bacterium]